jgi:peptidoglycan/LPS O-acetylase OafA/YrhL
VISIALTAALAILLYHFVEHPAIEFGKRLSSNLVGRPAFS